MKTGLKLLLRRLRLFVHYFVRRDDLRFNRYLNTRISIL